MNKHSKLILVLMILTYSFRFAFPQSYIEPEIGYAPRRYAARKHLQRLSRPKENFLKDTQDLLRNQYKLHQLILNSASASGLRSKPKEGSERCDEKCFKPSCHVQCSGRESLAACKAINCQSVTRGEDSASLCAGPRCVAKCFNKNCMATCDGSSCTGTCKGESCITVATGEQATSKCSEPHCMASVRGIQSVSQCEGNSCKATCSGDKCIASCTGAKCTAACQGKDCVAQCTGIGCKDLQEIAPQKVAVQSNNLREGKDQFQETNLLEQNVSALRNGMRNQDDNDDIMTFEYTVAVALNKKIQDFIRKHAAVYKNLKGWLSLLSQ